MRYNASGKIPKILGDFMSARRVKGLFLLYAVTVLVGCASPSLVSIQITPATETFIGAGGKAQFTAIGTYQQGDHVPTTQNITDVVNWESNAAGVATMSSTGVLLPRAGWVRLRFRRAGKDLPV
jgi:hypothetical protein